MTTITIDDRNLYKSIANALEFEIYNHDDAPGVVDSAFEAVITALLRHPRFAGMTRLEIELLLIDIKRDAEDELAPYQIIDSDFTARQIVRAVIDDVAEAAEWAEQTNEGAKAP